MSQQDKVCLIVDDNEFERAKMRRVMRAYCPEMQMIIARSVAEAMEKLEKRDVAIMFLENDLPDGNGTEMAMRLATDKDLGTTPVILFGDNPTPFMFAKAKTARNVREIWTKRDFSGPGVQRAREQHVRHAS